MFNVVPLNVGFVLLFRHALKLLGGYSSLLSFVLDNLLAGKCSLAINGRGPRVFWSNPLTQTNPANQTF